MSDGTRSSAITATAPASSAILAWSAFVTSMITPPLSISASPTFSLSVPVSAIAVVSFSGLTAVEPSVPAQPGEKACLGHRPFRLEQREGRGVANAAVGGGTVRAEHAVEARADPLDGRAGARVARVGVELHRVHVPRLERVREHQKLGLGVQRRALGRGGQPGPADLHHVGPRPPALVAVAPRPGPELDIAEER